MRRWRLRLALLLGSVTALTAGLIPLTAEPAEALPPGYFYLLDYGDRDPGGAYLGMDALNPAGQYTGYVYLDPAKTGRASQQWTADFVTDTTVRLRNRQYGYCIAYVVNFGGGRSDTGLANCNAAGTVWTANVFLNPTTSVFRIQIGHSAFECLASIGPPGARHVSANGCGTQATPPQQWQTARAP